MSDHIEDAPTMVVDVGGVCSFVELYREQKHFSVKVFHDGTQVWTGTWEEASELLDRLLRQMARDLLHGLPEVLLPALFTLNPDVCNKYMTFPGTEGFADYGKFPTRLPVYAALRLVGLIIKIGMIQKAISIGEEAWYEEFGLLSPRQWRASPRSIEQSSSDRCIVCRDEGLLHNKDYSAGCTCHVCGGGKVWILACETE